MDEKSTNLTQEDLLKKVFTKNVKGYDPDEVDSFLDQVIADYQAYEKYCAEARRYITDLEQKLRETKEEADKATLELAKAEKQLRDIKEVRGITPDNIGNVERIGRLENALYKLGVDPHTIR